MVVEKKNRSGMRCPRRRGLPRTVAPMGEPGIAPGMPGMDHHDAAAARNVRPLDGHQPPRPRSWRLCVLRSSANAWGSPRWEMREPAFAGDFMLLLGDRMSPPEDTAGVGADRAAGRPYRCGFAPYGSSPPHSGGLLIRTSRRRPTLPHSYRAVPSALEGLTAVFGMGTGGTPPPLSPGKPDETKTA